MILPTDLGYLALALHAESLQSSFIGSEYGPCLSSFNSSSSVLGMRVSWAKTKLQNIGYGVHGHPSNITVDGNTVEQVDNFI